MVTENSEKIQFKIGKKNIEINFSEVDITSNGGFPILRQVDKKLGLTAKLAKVIPEYRDTSKIQHTILSMVQQRIYGIALGYEDLIDHNDLNKDPGLKAVLGKEDNLASPSTLCRLEQQASRDIMIKVHKILFDHFISSYKEAPKEIVLDFDSTDFTIHGEQEGRHYHGYYGNYCFLPLYVFCGEIPLISYLRPSNQDGATHVWAILSLLVKNIRNVWPDTKIMFRGDSGFCRWKMLSWCEKNHVSYVVGLPKNSVLTEKAEIYILKAKEYYDHTQDKQVVFGEFQYKAKTWDKERRVIAKAEHTEKGPNLRFVATNLTQSPETIYKDIYCARGEMENHIKEQQLDLFADRTSCHEWWSNQFRMILSCFAFLLLHSIKDMALGATKLAKATANTIRLKLLKIGAAIVSKTKKIKFLLSNSYPYKDLFMNVLNILTPS